MNKFLQTIIFFVLVSVMVTFIYSALRPAQYVAESEFLVVSNNLEFSCNQNLGATLERILLSEAFQTDLQSVKESNKHSYDISKGLEVKKENKSNVVNVKVSGNSLQFIQNRSEDIREALFSHIDDYYPSQARIELKTLTNSKIIRTPKVIVENVLRALFVGIIGGVVLTVVTGLRIDIFEFNKNDKAKNRIIKKHKSSSKHGYSDYKTIIKKRLEKELSKKSTDNLILTDQEYVFKNASSNNKEKDFQEKENVQENNKLQKQVTITQKEGRKNKEATIVADGGGSEPHVVNQVRVISASTMLVSKTNKEIIEDKVPENLPIFIEEELPVVDKEKEENVINISEKTTDNHVEDHEEVIEKENGLSEDAQNYLKKENSQKIVGEEDTDLEKIPGIKPVSAHDIANGFAPDRKNDDGPSNEEIKDRLNKLLRGEL